MEIRMSEFAVDVDSNGSLVCGGSKCGCYSAFDRCHSLRLDGQCEKAVEDKKRGGIFADKDARIAALEAQLREREAEITAMKTKTYCAYCGKEYAIDTDAMLVAEHIAKCEKHPMRAVETALSAAREDAAKMRGACMTANETNVRRGEKIKQLQADLAAARAEKEKLSGALAYEHGQLEEARKIVQKAHRLNEVTGNDTWAWLGDGGDDLDSMSSDMIVVITAGDLRSIALRARPDDGRVEGVAVVIAEGDGYRFETLAGICRESYMDKARAVLLAADGEEKEPK